MEQENSQNYNPNKYRTPDGLPVDIVIFTLSSKDKETKNRFLPNYDLKVLLIQRKNWPFEKHWAFPGGFSNIDESLLDAAKRELKEETNISNDVLIEQLGTYYSPNRDPRGWIPSVVYYTIVNEDLLIDRKAADDASEVELISVYDAINNYDLAFDHKEILQDALNRIQEKMMTTDLAKEFLPDEFTIGELYNVIKTVVPDYNVQKSNFIKKLTKSKSRKDLLEEVFDEFGKQKTASKHSQRSAKLYKFSGKFKPLTLY